MLPGALGDLGDGGGAGAARTTGGFTGVASRLCRLVQAMFLSTGAARRVMALQ
ncbi:hypothetical protein SFR_6108 [Streptomyces sp. FR-008]|nr:hypothetical protein SFR_6108 [Streptomyces sp. FR-008]